MLSERAQNLLKILVERYIVDGQPVGSRALSRFSSLDLSPATIRNVMADLEEMGFVASPHTSAGRVPTPKGYRFFVDTLLTVRPMEEMERQQLEEQLTPDDPHRVVAAASQILSDLTVPELHRVILRLALVGAVSDGVAGLELGRDVLEREVPARRQV